MTELEAEVEELRLAKLQESLQKYRQAADWEWAGEQFSVAHGLASNTHAVVQVGRGGANDIAHAFLLRDILQERDTQPTANTTTPTRRTSSKNQPVKES